MPKGKKVTCPECKWTYTPALDGQDIYCNGKRTKDSIPHKKARLMK